MRMMMKSRAISDKKIEHARKHFAEWAEKFAGSLVFEDIRWLLRNLGVGELALDDTMVGFAQILAGPCKGSAAAEEPEEELYLEAIKS